MSRVSFEAEGAKASTREVSAPTGAPPATGEPRRRGLRTRWDPLAAWDPAADELWPGVSQRLLLRALLLQGEAASEAWSEWSACNSFDRLAPPDEALLSTLYLEAERLNVNTDVRAKLRAAYVQDWTRNQRALNRLRQVVQQLEAAGVPTVALKGAALLAGYYKDVGGRMMADVDVLVRESDLESAVRVLDDAGWRSPPGGPPPREVARSLHGAPWAHPEGVSLDLHWHPFTPECPPAAVARFWNRTEVRDSGFGAIRVPSPADLLILICFHGRKQDRYATSRWVVDAMRVIAAADPPIDWNEVLEQSRASGLLPPVRDALAYLARELGANIPGDFLRAARSIHATPAEMTRYAYLTRNQVVERGMVEIVAEHWWRYQAICAVHGDAASPLGFVRSYRAIKQWEWNADGKWWVPLRAARSIFRRARSYGF